MSNAPIMPVDGTLHLAEIEVHLVDLVSLPSYIYDPRTFIVSIKRTFVKYFLVIT